MSQTATTTTESSPPGEADTRLRRTVKDGGRSAFQKYQDLAVGQQGVVPFIRYELLHSFVSSMPGALGLWLRQKLYPRLLGECGRNVVFGRNVVLRQPSRICIGDDVTIDDNVVLDGKGDEPVTLRIESGTMIARNTILSCKGGWIRLGAGANISVNCTLISETRLDVGRKVLLAGHCYLIAGGNHGMDKLDVAFLDQPLEQKGGVTIQYHSWLGAGVIVLDGTAIGHDTVVGAGAVVTTNLPPYVIAGGVPARAWRERQEVCAND